jgi:hypothetical protein
MSNDLVKRLRTRPLYEGHGDESELPNDAADEIERLRAALRWQEDRDAKGNGSTHAGDCHTWGPRHYECALAKIEALEAENAKLREALEPVDPGKLLIRVHAILEGK